MPLQATSGAASYDAFGGGVAAVPNYIEDVFSTWLYAGNGSTQTINNGIDLAGKGGLVWIKSRGQAANHRINDTAAAIAGTKLATNTTAALATEAAGLTSFNSNGFSIGSDGTINTTNDPLVSWTFRKQPKFFDVVTWTGDGSSQQVVSHSLGSAPGFITCKATSTTGDWWSYHRASNATPASAYLKLNTTDALVTGSNFWGVTSTSFTARLTLNLNTAGVTYVAYLFAHNAGGFGLTGTDNVISCGSFTTDGSGNASVTLGYEPQFWLYKPVGTGGWTIYDTMRGWSQTSIFNLNPNTSGAEGGGSVTAFYPTATGFDCVGGNLNPSATYIYIAIRRGPMKVPTDGTSVFAPATWTGNNTTGRNIPTGFPVDLTIEQIRTASSIQANLWFDRVRGYSSTITGASAFLRSQVTDAESSLPDYNYVPTMDGFNFGSTASLTTQFNNSGVTAVAWNFRRAPGFFDEVCYTGTGAGGSPNNVSHNLGAVPELIIVKRRTFSGSWAVYSSATGNSNYLLLNTTDATTSSSTVWNNTTPTSSVFTVGNNGLGNSSGEGYVAYLFASCPGVSKVTNFTGNGTSQTINCGFTSGARFVMIKATSTTGNWTVFDSARGISAGGDPALYLNSTAAEVTGVDAIDADSTGFIVNQEGTFNLNASGVQYLVLAIS